MSVEEPFTIDEFAEIASGGAWKPFDHLGYVCEMLEYVVRGRVSRLMVFMPPRHGKSDLVSHYFLTWFLGNFPDKRVILTTHSASFSRKWGRRARNLLNYIGKDIFGESIELAEDSSAADNWNIKGHEGGLVTAGVGGAILGEGAHGFIIDDPTKGFKKARSKTHQRELNDWWFTEAKTRLNASFDDGVKPWVIGIWQRLNIDDLAGQILYKKDGEKRVPNEPHISYQEAIELLDAGEDIPYGTWVILNLPAIAQDDDPLGREPGEPLWPEQKPIEELHDIKREMGSFRFNAVYQGEPREPEGNVFFRRWFSNSKMSPKEMDKIIEKLPSLRYWDLGASGEDGDPTAAIYSAWDGEYLYFRKLLHKGLTALQVEKYFVDITLRDGKQTRVKIEQEPGASPKVLISNLSRAKGLGKGFSIRPDRVRDYGDKLTRSFDLQALAEDDKVRISSDIYDLVVDELVEFTGEEGGQDNITDVCTGSARHWKRKRAKPRAY